VDQVNVPTKDGRVGILPRHAPLLTILDVGELTIIKDGASTPFAVSGGFMEVLPNRVTILADTAERADEIDEARAEAARRRAEEQIAQRQSNQDIALAEAELRRALIRLKVAQLKRNRRQ
jgi:F-type H+-transporting ATPase subunit epsilon